LRAIPSRAPRANGALRARRTTGLVVTAVVAAVPVGLHAAPALAASPPSFASAFTPNLIGLGDSTATAVSYTITNPNASGTLTAVSFTDTLPAGLTVDDPNGENGTCGSAGVITATPGGQTVSLTGGSVKAAASCTISVSVVPAQTGTFQDNPGVANSSAGASAAAAPQTLTVLPPPTVSVSHIKNNAKYTFGEVVRPTYSCAQPGDPSGLADCSAEDDLGNDIASAGALKTKIPGSHSLTVSATSADGLVATDTVNYTVLPDNRFSVSHVKPKRSGALGLQVTLPGAGKVTVVELVGKRTFGQFTGSVSAPRKLHVTIKPTSAGRTLLGQSPSGVKVTLQVGYTPKGGVRRTVTKRGIRLTSK
jgi:hypothetical protein